MVAYNALNPLNIKWQWVPIFSGSRVSAWPQAPVQKEPHTSQAARLLAALEAEDDTLSIVTHNYENIEHTSLHTQA
jgi:hypothetical protein